jgi:urease accessory protein
MKIYLSKNWHGLVFLLALLAPDLAHAHSMAIAVVDWSSGFSHPLQGLDHIIAMLAVGFWAAQLRGIALWALPLTFVSVMSVGGLIGTQGLTIPSAELIILLSVLVLSVLAVRKVRFDTKINVLIVAFFAFFHGYAHGVEIADSADFWSYSVGFLTATLVLHGAGMLTTIFVQFTIKSKYYINL